MNLQKENHSGRSLNLYVVPVVFFVVFYLVLRFYIEPKLIYHHFELSRKVPFFKTGLVFLSDCLSYPGGPSLYPAAFFTQLCYFSWLGALCITLIAWSIYRLTASLTAVATDSLWRVICYIPAILILMICIRYGNPLSTSTAILFVVFFAVLYEKLSAQLGRVRVILFLIVSGVLYYITGGAALVFVALAALIEFFHRRKPLFGVLFILLGLAMCGFLGACVFNLETADAYLYSSPFIPVRQNLEKEKWARLFEEILFVVLPVILLVNSGRKLVFGKKETSYRLLQGRFKWAVQLFLLLLIAVPGIFFSFDREAKKGVQMSFYACRRMWPEVLATARKIPMQLYSSFCNHAANRALYHTGRLGDLMFTFPQNYITSDLVFNRDQHINVVLMGRADLCLELGLVNEAERIAYEFLEASDDGPFILQQFVLINVVKGQMETTRVFLRALSKNLIYGRRAENILAHLEADPQLESDEHIQYLRSVKMTTDRAYAAFNERVLLEELLRINRHNRLAFEYLMARYLLNRQLDKFVENLFRLEDFPYVNIPRHFQEAIVLYTSKTGQKVDLGGRGINPEVISQYDEFNKIGKEFARDKNAAWRALAPEFGRTYFFYYSFGVSGVWK
jgi:hypothetical protein